MTGTPDAKEDSEDGMPPRGTLQAQTKPSKHRVKPQDKLSFAFGPGYSYFLVTAHEWEYSGSSLVCDELSKMKLQNIATATITSLGDGLILNCPPKKGHFVSKWQQINHLIPVDQAKEWAGSWEQLQRLHGTLENRGSEDRRSDFAVTWGDGSTWWAGWNEGEWTGNQLPQTLSYEILSKQALNIKPRHVALGRSGSWVALWNDGGFSFELKGYEKLAIKLNDTEKEGIEYIALDPHTSEHYFMIWDGGDVSYSVRLLDNGTNSLFDHICRYQQRRAWRDKKTYSQQRYGTGHKDYSIEITPDSDWISTKASQHGAIMNLTNVFSLWSSIRIYEEGFGFRSLASTFVGGLTGAAITTGLWRTYAKRPSTYFQHRSFATMRQGARLLGKRLGFSLGVAVGALSAYFYTR